MRGKMRGLFFSMILIFTVFTMITVIFIQRSLVAKHSSALTVEFRAEAMANYYKSLSEDAKRAMNIVSRRALSSAISYVISKGSGLSEANYTLVELITNGTINGEPQPLMENSTIIDWKNSLERLSTLENLDANINISNITIKPFDPFDLVIEFDLYASLSDKNFKINFTRKERMETIVEIKGFEDPLYPLYTYGRVVNVFIYSPHWGNYSSEDLTNLLDDVDNSYYHPSKYGASFLDRLEGKCLVQDKYRSDKDIGLESFVKKEKILMSGIPVYWDRSNIDYIYFCNSSVTAYQIAGAPSSFRLDNESSVYYKTHLQIYNVSVVE